MELTALRNKPFKSPSYLQYDNKKETLLCHTMTNMEVSSPGYTQNNDSQTYVVVENFSWNIGGWRNIRSLTRYV